MSTYSLLTWKLVKVYKSCDLNIVKWWLCDPYWCGILMASAYDYLKLKKNMKNICWLQENVVVQRQL